MRARTWVILAAAIMLAASAARAGKKVLIVSLDGCRPDALALAGTPNVDALAAAGSASFDARNILDYGSSGPNYSSLLTGVNWPKHGVTDNSFSGSRFDVWLNMYERIEAFDASLYTAAFAGWGPINSGTWTDRFADETGELGDTGNRDRIADLLTSGDPDVIFWQISAPDSAGHSHGFSPTSASYLAAIETADGYYGTILAALYGRPGYLNGSEEWLILTVTDHGGFGTSHHSEDPGLTAEERLQIQKTFYIATGPTVPVGADLGQPRIYDVAVTAMEHLGLDTSGMNLDGQVVLPEPATLALLAAGLGAIAVRRRRA